MLRLYLVNFTIHYTGKSKFLGARSQSKFRQKKESPGLKKKTLIMAREGQNPEEVFWEKRRKKSFRSYSTIESIDLLTDKNSSTDYEKNGG